MNLRVTTDITRTVAKAARAVRHASVTSALVKNKSAGQEGHGRQIFAYCNLQTNQVIYSLTRGVKNNHALRQLPFNGKKTVPAALRKDLWHPFATIEFPADACAAGLKTFQQLREYRRLHELCWPSELCLDKDGKKLRRRERGRKLNDQKANSVADMAAALKNVTMRNVVGRKTEKQVVKPVVNAKISWADILDAEFAESWPEAVVHDKWETTRNNRGQRSGAGFVQAEEAEVEREEEVVPPLKLQKDELGRIIL